MTLEQLITEYQLSAYTDRILAVAKDCVIGNTAPGYERGVKRDNVPETQSMVLSHAGGFPLVPRGFEWPMKGDRPLEFVLQFSCSELSTLLTAPDGTTPLLPSGGLLSFFYDNVHWGYDQKDEGFVRVFHFQDPVSLVRSEPPEFEQSSWFGLKKSVEMLEPYRFCPLVFDRRRSLPSLEGGRFALDNEEDEESYYELIASMEPFVQIAGWPMAIQSDDMQAEVAELLARGTADDWLLLLQVGDNSGTDMMWGDAGKLYFWIHREDLAAHRFDRVWMVCQSH